MGQILCNKHGLWFEVPRIGAPGGCPKCALEDRFRVQPYAQQLQGRWLALLAQPDLLDQDSFGVCGMTSAVYLLLKHNPERATQLYEATFADTVDRYRGKTFETAEHRYVEIKFMKLARKFQLRVERKAAEAPVKGYIALKEEWKKRGGSDATLRPAQGHGLGKL
jgi:hypothetical protein